MIRDFLGTETYLKLSPNDEISYIDEKHTIKVSCLLVQKSNVLKCETHATKYTTLYRAMEYINREAAQCFGMPFR